MKDVNELVSATQSGTQSATSVFPLHILGIYDGFQIEAKTDMPMFSVLIGKRGVGESDFVGVVGAEQLDPEYSEYQYMGYEDLGISYDDFILQDEVANGQVSWDSGLTDPGSPVDIQPVGSFDALLRLAGKCARELGKHPNVNYDNLKKPYDSNIHGKCPQGTQAVLYALTGIKAAANISGDGHSFSFKSGAKSKLPSKYFNDKIKIGKEYWKDKSQWQIGDVVSIGYLNNRPWGHIQVWTGFYWMSDFKQNGLQTSNVDWNTPALWRLNEAGIEAAKKQSGSMKA
jgi:hypothetical protein